MNRICVLFFNSISASKRNFAHINSVIVYHSYTRRALISLDFSSPLCAYIREVMCFLMHCINMSSTYVCVSVHIYNVLRSTSFDEYTHKAEKENIKKWARRVCECHTMAEFKRTKFRLPSGWLLNSSRSTTWTDSVCLPVLSHQLVRSVAFVIKQIFFYWHLKLKSVK